MRSNREKALIVICVYNEWLQLQLFYREESQDNLKCVSNNLWVWFVLRGNGWFYCASVEQRIQRIFWPYPLKYFVVHEWDDQLCTQGHVWSWYNIGARQILLCTSETQKSSWEVPYKHLSFSARVCGLGSVRGGLARVPWLNLSYINRPLVTKEKISLFNPNYICVTH